MQIKHCFAKVCIGAGVACLLIAVGLLIQTAFAEYNATKAITSALSVLGTYERVAQSSEPNRESASPADENTTNSTDTLTVNDCVYSGILTIPALSLALPVQETFSYENLNSSPCIYAKPKGDALVIAAHNYAAHFGSLPELSIDDTVVYTPIKGEDIPYRVIEISTIQETDLEAVEGDEDELILFTCSSNNNRQRVVVRCSKSETSA